jgi:hypothetical protein
MLQQEPIPQKLRQLVEREMARGESILWMSLPIPRFFNVSSLAIFLFAIPWTAFAVFWVAMAFSMTSKSGEGMISLVFPLFGVPFILVGLGMLSVPYWNYRKMKRTLYVVTARRAITIEDGSTSVVCSYGPELLARTTRVEKSDGSGDLIFEEVGGGDYNFSRRRSGVQRRGFIGVGNVREAEAVIREVVAAGKRRESESDDRR